MRRAIGLAVLLAVLAVPARADVSGNVNVYWTEQPRLVSKIPLWVHITSPASYRATIAVSVDGKSLVTLVREGHTSAAGDAFPDVPLSAAQRRAIASAAAAAKVRPVVSAIVDARYDATGALEIASGSSRMRLAPFYDGRLRFPDAPQDKSWSIAVDLPGEWTQVYGALEGTYAPGSFARYVGGRSAGCRVHIDVFATTALRAPLRRYPLSAVRTFRAPRKLPGTRPLVVVRADALTTGPCGTTVARAAVRRAVQTAVVRRAAPQPGPGFDTA